MTRNVGGLDRTLRVVIGIALSSMAFIGPANPWFLLGLIPVVTGAVGWCPPYSMLGMSTCKVSTAPARR